MITVNGISKKYGDHYAVKNLSIEIEKGKVYGFLGPNGAGKTTTMNIMTGYIAACDGNVTVNGHDIVKEAEEAKKCLGYLPELPPLYQDMTVKEYLRFVAELKNVKKTERSKQIDDVMKKTFIGDMQIGEMRDAVAVEGGRQIGELKRHLHNIRQAHAVIHALRAPSRRHARERPGYHASPR